MQFQEAGGSLWAIVSRDQFKPIRIGEALVVDYNETIVFLSKNYRLILALRRNKYLS